MMTKVTEDYRQKALESFPLGATAAFTRAVEIARSQGKLTLVKKSVAGG